MSDDIPDPPRRVPMDVAVFAPRMRNRLAAEHLEALRRVVDEAMKVLPKRELADMLQSHMIRVLRS